MSANGAVGANCIRQHGCNMMQFEMFGFAWFFYYCSARLRGLVYGSHNIAVIYFCSARLRGLV